MLKETEQGRAWMKYLTVEPEVPADLLNKILARTSGSRSRESPPPRFRCRRAQPGTG